MVTPKKEKYYDGNIRKCSGHSFNDRGERHEGHESYGRPVETKNVKNAVLRTGRQSLAKCLANIIGDSFQLFVSRMLFGDGGTVGDVPRYVNSDRNGLFGTTQASKPVIASIDPNNATQVVFTSVLTFADANGISLNEMALQLNTGDFYSMATFPDIGKTSLMQITFNWRINYT